jgi:dihydrodipicolinate synthase/N-acetylneuraminate lyase
MLSDSDLERYARQVIMPSIGEDGQEQLLAAKVLIVGAGGWARPLSCIWPPLASGILRSLMMTLYRAAI